MSKISRTGAGGSGPIGSPEPAESLKETSTASESAATTSTTPDLTPTVPKPVAGDRNVAGDLKAAGSFLKAELHKELDTKKLDANKEKEMALRVAQNMQRFAPPYVPVGPVVMGDNIATPTNSPSSGQMNELNLRADQFQINDQGKLVITNEKLIEFFKGLMGSSQEGQDIRLGFVKLKPPGEE